MAFGQASGPPATARQINELRELLERAGHADFRDARGPMGFTQRQAGGKFTASEAETFIEQLNDAEHRAATGEPPSPPPKQTAKLTAADLVLRGFTDQEIAAELQRRGWIVVEP